MSTRNSGRRTLVWQGQTPDGYRLVIEKESDGHWTATVAGVIRSRHTSLKAAIVEAAGPATPHEWANDLAAALTIEVDARADP